MPGLKFGPENEKVEPAPLPVALALSAFSASGPVPSRSMAPEPPALMTEVPETTFTVRPDVPLYVIPLG